MSLILFSGFNDHWKLQGLHAFLGASKPQWLNYDDEKLVESYYNSKLAELGTRYHNLAKELIELKVKLPNNTKTLNRYVNDAIGFNMKPEVVLYYSDVCFGTADSISFREEKKEDVMRWTLRIHDLKTGTTKPHVEQLLIYAALFCLEYNIDPRSIDTHLRLYYSNDIIYFDPTPEDILAVCDKIRNSNKIIQERKEII